MGWLSAILGLAGLLGGHSGSSTGATADPTQQSLINETLGVQMKRMNQQNPLYEAVQRLAMRLMPTAVQQPIQPWADVSPLGNVNTPQNGGHDNPGPGNEGHAIPRPPQTPPPVPPSGGGGDTPGGPGDPGNSIPQNIMMGPNGIDPRILAQLFGRR